MPAAVAVVRLQHARACGKMFGETSAKAFSVHVSIDIAAPFHGARCVEHFLDADFGDHVRMRADDNAAPRDFAQHRSEEHTSELQSLMRISYAVFCLKKKKKQIQTRHT